MDKISLILICPWLDIDSLLNLTYTSKSMREKLLKLGIKHIFKYKTWEVFTDLNIYYFVSSDIPFVHEWGKELVLIPSIPGLITVKVYPKGKLDQLLIYKNGYIVELHSYKDRILDGWKKGWHHETTILDRINLSRPVYASKLRFYNYYKRGSAEGWSKVLYLDGSYINTLFKHDKIVEQNLYRQDRSIKDRKEVFSENLSLISHYDKNERITSTNLKDSTIRKCYIDIYNTDGTLRYYKECIVYDAR